ncbi:MAG: AAA family ATPase [Bacteroidota bacterium]
MKLKDFASKIVAENDFIKVSLGGFAGSGKTRTASELIVGFYKKTGLKKPLLIIDNEKGSRFLIPMFEKAGIETYVKETVSLPDVLEAFKMLETGEIGALFIDSLTKIWYNYVRNYKEKNKRAFMTLQDWGKILPAWQEQFADVFVNVCGNIVFTGRGGYTYDMEENEETKKKEFVKSGVKMKMAGETPFEPDLNIWMEVCQDIVDGKVNVWREALIMKDRSGLIDGKTFKNPTFANFEPVIDYLLNAPKGSVAKISDNSNITPSENYEAQNRKEQREIELEKLKNLFIKAGLGTSQSDKELKLFACEKSFFEPNIAWGEIEKRHVEEIKKGREVMEAMFSSLDYKITKEGLLSYQIPLLD